MADLVENPYVQSMAKARWLMSLRGPAGNPLGGSTLALLSLLAEAGVVTYPGHVALGEALQCATHTVGRNLKQLIAMGLVTVEGASKLVDGVTLRVSPLEIEQADVFAARRLYGESRVPYTPNPTYPIEIPRSTRTLQLAPAATPKAVAPSEPVVTTTKPAKPKPKKTTKPKPSQAEKKRLAEEKRLKTEAERAIVRESAANFEGWANYGMAYIRNNCSSEGLPYARGAWLQHFENDDEGNSTEINEDKWTVEQLSFYFWHQLCLRAEAQDPPQYITVPFFGDKGGTRVFAEVKNLIDTYGIGEAVRYVGLMCTYWDLVTHWMGSLGDKVSFDVTTLNNVAVKPRMDRLLAMDGAQVSEAWAQMNKEITEYVYA